MKSGSLTLDNVQNVITMQAVACTCYSYRMFAPYPEGEIGNSGDSKLDSLAQKLRLFFKRI